MDYKVNPNLAPLRLLKTAQAKATIENYHWYVDKTATAGGIYLQTTELTAGETYTLSYKFRKTTGTLEAIGGHAQAFTQVRWFVDGVQQSTTYMTGSALADDDTIHEIIYVGKYNGTSSDNNLNLYIQPNRRKSTLVNFECWDIKVELGSEATPWLPAEEDMAAEQFIGAINPYQDVNFSSCLRVPSFTHAHCETQAHLNKMLTFGYEFFPISNYYPSKPTDASRFESVPEDIIIAPNAEHHNMLFNNRQQNSVHICSVGSLWESGNPKGEGTAGVAKDWKVAFNGILDNLKYPDAGGITINHPNWSNDYWDGLNVPFWCMLLDYDERVLGIEIFNTSSERDYGNGRDLDTWDAILATGRRCWGFVVPDWDIVQRGGVNGWGKIVLLLDNFTEYDGLKAIRDGRFYGQKLNTNLGFVSLGIVGENYVVSTANAERIVIIEDGVATEYEGNSAVHTFDKDATYVRAEAYAGDDEIYSNPIILRPVEYTFRENYGNKKISDDFFFIY